MLADSTNTIVWEGIYKPFGEANVNPNSSVVNNFRFAGQYYDEETGLHYNWHRYYDPQTGRYLTADPIGLDGGINLFLYSENNPVNLVDPDGLWSIVIGFGVRGISPLGAAGEGGGYVVFGTQGGKLRLKVATYKELFPGAGLSIGRGPWGGFWSGSVCEMENAFEKGFDSPIGSASFLFDPRSSNFGITIGGPSSIAGTYVKGVPGLYQRKEKVRYDITFTDPGYDLPELLTPY